jgi:hypothetical protein|tara:strand:+ start:2016 stop:2228 length:213 start_codon:yes stop_codon:yes gene_type:complete
VIFRAQILLIATDAGSAIFCKGASLLREWGKSKENTSDPVMISAIGPQAERFNGIVPNQEVHRHFLELLG